MAGGYPWSPEEERALTELDNRAYDDWARRTGHPPRGDTAKAKRRSTLRNPDGGLPKLNGTQSPRDELPTLSVTRTPPEPRRPEPSTVPTRHLIDKRTPTVGWRDHLDVVRTIRDHRERGSRTQDHGTVRVETDRPICVLVLSDTHLGSVGADVDAFVRITEEILAIPELFVILAGDLLNMAIQVKHGVGSFHEDVLTPGQQFDLLDDWLGEIAPKVIAATWDNHAQEREEKAVGTSTYARLLADRCLYHNGIGHLAICPGAERYEWAVTHKFRFRSKYNPVWGQQCYIREQAPHIEIAAAGDSHVPGYAWWVHGGEPKLALNAGSLHTGSRYAKRYFSLTTATNYPCVALWPDTHRVVCFPSVADWLATR